MHCKDCKFWQDLTPEIKSDIEKSGRCRRNAPPVELLGEEEDDSSLSVEWPFTEFNDWCGEFKAKEEPFEVIEGIEEPVQIKPSVYD